MAAIFIRTLLIYILLTLSLRITGKRQIGELEVSELICTLLISEVAALPIADPDIPLLNAVIPVLLIVSVEIIISYLKNKSTRLKKLIEGEPVFLIFRGELSLGALSDSRISVNELLSELRAQGFSDIGEVYYALLEADGSISAFKKSDGFAHAIIIDKEVNRKSMALIHYSDKELSDELKARKMRKDDILLMTVSDGKKISIMKREEQK